MRMICLAKRPHLQIPLLTLFFSTLQVHTAEAYYVKRHVPHLRHVERPAACAFSNDSRYVCATPQMTRRAPTRRVAGVPTRRVAGVVLARVSEGTIIGSRPADCPRAYCGCGLRKHLGISDVRLNLAANWARLFPREASPRAGLAAVRRNHVMYIEASAGNGLWTVRDYNSGGGLSRIHIVDVRGHTFVNPHARLAGAASDRVLRQALSRRARSHSAVALAPAPRTLALARASSHVDFAGH